MGDSALSVRLLGGFELRSGDQPPARLESGRAETLLAYLALHRGHPQTRQQVAFSLWPDSSESQALTNLRHLLHTVRQAVPDLDRYVATGARTLCWREDEPHHLDVAAFEDAFARKAWMQAVELYSGDLLAGLTDDWVQDERARLRRCHLEALQHLMAERQMAGELAGAAAAAQRLLQEEPLREDTYRFLMRLYDGLGDRARAARVYHECAAVLERELGVEPAAETRAAYDALLAPSEPGGPDAVRRGGQPFVGRAAERAALADAWHQMSRSPRVVLLAGEPGIGKTRLAEEFLAWCARRGAVVAGARAFPGEGALAYGPIVGWLRSDGLRRHVHGMAPPYLTELSRLLPELLVDTPGLPQPERLPESDQRRRLFDAVAQVLLAPGPPLVLLADDVQWWDSESLRLVQYVVRRAGPPRLVVATARREDLETATALRELLDAFHRAATVTELELAGLGRAETQLLVEQLGRSRVDGSHVAELHAQTEGNPLFLVEAVRADWHPGEAVMTHKVHAVVASRLAQLSEGSRELVDVAATIGREFTADLLSHAAQVPDETLVRDLDELWRRRIIRERDNDAYEFSHDRIREVAHDALSPVRRRALHRRVAQALEAAPGTDATQLAQHYDEAGDAERAVAAYARAADAAQRLYAHGEAVRLLSRALHLLERLPEAADRDRRELELSTALLAPLVATEGYASSRIHQVHERAMSLARVVGSEPTPPLLRSLGLGCLAQGDFAGARAAGEALCERGQRDDDDVLRVEGEYLLGVAAFWAADLEDAREHFTAAVARYHDENRREHLLRYAQDPKVVCLTRLALTSWHLGDRDSALRFRDAGLAWAEEIDHPYTLGVALIFAAILAVDMRDQDAVRPFVDRLKAITPEEVGVQVKDAVAALDVYLGVCDGRSPDGVAQIQRIVAAAPEQAAPGLRSALLRILLAACEVANDPAAGLLAADELLGLTNSLLWRPEAQRLRSRFLALERPGSARRNARGTPAR